MKNIVVLIESKQMGEKKLEKDEVLIYSGKIFRQPLFVVYVSILTLIFSCFLLLILKALFYYQSIFPGLVLMFSCLWIFQAIAICIPLDIQITNKRFVIYALGLKKIEYAVSGIRDVTFSEKLGLTRIDFLLDYKALFTQSSPLADHLKEKNSSFPIGLVGIKKPEILKEF